MRPSSALGRRATRESGGMKRASATEGRRAGVGAKAEQGVGEALRRLRKERHLSVRTLGSRAGFSPSFVSQVELNQASPSIASLQRLAVALDVTLGSFFPQPASSGPAITRSGKRQQVTSWWSRAQIEPLTPMGTGRAFDAMMITIATGGSSGKRPYAHRGYQFAIVFDGELQLTLGEEVQTLVRGDGVTFNAEIPYRWVNASRRRAQLLIVSSPLARSKLM
jgi:transcriptional regulator with XRE-family HTH domain